MANYLYNGIDLSNIFTLSYTIPNGSQITTGYSISYNTNKYDIAQVYNNITNVPEQTSYLITSYKNASNYDLGQIFYTPGVYNIASNSIGASIVSSTSSITSFYLYNYTLYVTGNFTKVYAQTTTFYNLNFVGMFNTKSATWSPLGSSTDASNGIYNQFRPVYCITRSKNKLFLGGTFQNLRDAFTGDLLTNLTVACYDLQVGNWSREIESATTVTGGPSVRAILNVYDKYICIAGIINSLTSRGTKTNNLNNIAFYDPSSNYCIPLGSGTGTTNTGTSPTNTNNGTSGAVYALSLLNYKIYVGGLFAYVKDSSGQKTANNIAVYDINTSLWSVFGTGTNGTVFAVYTRSNYLYIGGKFTTVNGYTDYSCFASLELDTNIWRNPFLTPKFYSTNNNATAVYAINNEIPQFIFIGGYFNSVTIQYDDSIVNNIIMCNDSLTDIKLLGSGNLNYLLGSNTNNGTNNIVQALSVVNNILYLGGTFTRLYNVNNSYLVNNLGIYNISNNSWVVNP